MIVDGHRRGAAAECLKMTLDVFDDRSLFDAVQVDIEDRACRAIRVLDRFVPHLPIDRDVLAAASLDHLAGQRYCVSLPIANRIDAERVRDSEGCRLPRSEFSPAGPAGEAVEVLPMHSKEMIEGA